MKLTVITINSTNDFNQWRDFDTDFISFVPEGTNLPDDYFYRLMKVYADRPAYRKISMVSPVVSIPSTEIYSWNITDSGYSSTDIRRSTEPYAVQISYLPGAVIKKTALQKLNPEFTGDDLQDSINFSVALWRSGLRCFVDPESLYESENFVLEEPMMYSHPVEEFQPLIEMFKREYIR